MEGLIEPLHIPILISILFYSVVYSAVDIVPPHTPHYTTPHTLIGTFSSNPLFAESVNIDDSFVYRMTDLLHAISSLFVTFHLNVRTVGIPSRSIFLFLFSIIEFPYISFTVISFVASSLIQLFILVIHS
jgi:hypothetical protein